MLYALDELLDHRNRPLYEELSAQAPVVLSESDDDCWGEKYRDGAIHISCAATGRPVACFTHELLHGKYELAGMEMPHFQVAVPEGEDREELEDYARELMGYAYNQMIHHKLFPDFVALGFAADEFLHDSDKADGLRGVAKDIADLKARRKKEFPDGVPARLMVWPYLHLRNPHEDNPEAQRLLKDLRNMSGNAYYALNGLLSRFIADPSPDVARYLARLFYLCDQSNVGFGREIGEMTWAWDCTTD